ncbi:HD domain-containing phosphohydrolase [Botrimarina hoheduenensis]|uniref:Cyclic di-GMP phosphodiesterase response regulator RpfG n=1 Tax=Botrimarina hoheduenensis TaxID=2528000 RepID=A0A5C5WF89_9BACT|nr:HD domain-containing phosphohydrolase [Botrimarina hoheduenensis]TWT48735.1 Cyclic di-GMP phosphodiesterase response regulator RpfG [Botrimarina hoheduenensis]
MPAAFGFPEAILFGASLLVFVMQAGFCALEAGVVRSKNAIHVAVKNLLDLFVSVGIFWGFGLGIAYGATCGGLFGEPVLMPNDWDGPGGLSFVFYQLAFCGAAATIVSGAVTERIQTRAYLVLTMVLAAVIYPVAAHWAWAGDASGPAGWLGRIGFIDYSGSTIIHGLGAWCALAVLLQLGPRRGRYEAGGVESTTGGNLIFSALGVLVLWFGWFGFNAGNAFLTPELIPKIVINTLLAPVAGGGVVVLWQTLSGRVFRVREIMTATVGSLVAVTASCHLLEPRAACVIGIVGAALAIIAAYALERMRIDDPLDAVAAHGVAGVWGTLGLCLLVPADALTMTRWEQLGVQSLGVLSVFAFSFCTMSAATAAWRAWRPLRVPAHAEIQGLNIAEHGARSEFWDLVTRARGAATCRIGGGTRNGSDTDDFSEFGVLRETIEELIEVSEAKAGALETRIERAHEESVKMLVDLAECRDTETAAHIRRIQLYCDVLADELQIATPHHALIVDTVFRDSLRRASVLHDVGKVGIPDSVLLKPGRFNPEERAVMETHTVIGAQMLARAINRFEEPPQYLTMAEEVARSHHERFDGKGYPDRLEGERIPLSARIVAVADVFDALISKRVYKEAFAPIEARASVVAGSGTQFDPEVVACFLARFDELVAIHDHHRERFVDERSAGEKKLAPVIAGA